MDAAESQRLTEAGRRAAQAWLDEHGATKKWVLPDGREMWLQVFVGHDGTTEVVPCTRQPTREELKEDGPAPGPDGEPGMALKLWRPLEYVTVDSGTRVAVYVETEALDDQGNPRDLWMPM